MSLTILIFWITPSFFSLDRITSPFSFGQPHIDHDISVENWCLVQQHWWQSGRYPGTSQGPSLPAGRAMGSKHSQTCPLQTQEVGKIRVNHSNYQATPAFIHYYFTTTPLHLFNFTWSNYCLLWSIIYKIDKILFF